MKKSDFPEFKALLKGLRARLQGDVEQLTDEALGSNRQDGGGESKSPTHMAELGSDTFEQDFALSLVENEQETLVEIRAALKRIEEGTFGACEGCVQEGKSEARAIVPKARLRAIPWARNCVECERKREEFD